LEPLSNSSLRSSSADRIHLKQAGHKTMDSQYFKNLKLKKEKEREKEREARTSVGMVYMRLLHMVYSLVYAALYRPR
jgi:hypothetical protein